MGSQLFSQTNKANVWCFGDKAGVDFNSGAPVAFARTATTNLIEGSSSMCDEFGNLLFYASGVNAWDKSHVVMPNGSGLLGYGSSTQGALITPVIGTCDKYYLFTVGAYEQGANLPGLHYSIIDMSLQGNGTISCPLGDIPAGSKNIHLTPAPLKDSLDEKITSVMHSNGTDYWIIVRELATNVYYSYLVTAAGINTVPVQSATGGAPGVGSWYGYLKPTKDGKQLVGARLWCFNSSGNIPRFIELIDFNNTTGALSNAQKINVVNDHFWYGVAFSCNDSVIYATGAQFFGSYKLYQYQRFAPVVSATETVVTNLSDASSLQLGPDGKIYNFTFIKTSLDVINNPNSVASPNFATSIVPLVAGTRSMMGSPNIFHGYEREFCNSFSSSGNTNTICLGDSVALGKSHYTTCHSYSWSPAAGLSNTSALNPIAKPLVPTTYTLTVTTLNCDTYTDTFRVNVLPLPVAVISGNQYVCAGSTITLTASSGINYNWNTGATTNTISVSPSLTTSYTVVVSDGSCTNTAVTTVTFVPLPVAAISGLTSVCIGDSVSLSATVVGAYVWSTGELTPAIKVGPLLNFRYYLTSSNICGNAVDSVDIVVHSLPVIVCSAADTICAGQNSILFASGGNTYSWFPALGLSSTTGNSVNVSPVLSSTYSVVGMDINGCVDSCNVQVEVNILPLVNAGASWTIQLGSNVQLSASAGGTYLWSPSAGLSCITCSTPIASPTETTTYYLTTTDANGCTAMDSLLVTVDLICGKYFIPNVFSPNADGENDVFYVYSNLKCVKDFSLKIYSRWGEMLFQTDDPQLGWNGIHNGKTMNSDVFVYQLNMILIDKSEIIKSGNITLLR